MVNRVFPILCALVFAALFAAPAFAQEDFPRIEFGMGFGHVELPDTITNAVTLVSGVVSNSGHSGFVSQQGFNFTRWLGVENYLGYYGAGQNSNFFTSCVGLKAAYRDFKKVVPYGSAGFGGSSLSLSEIGGTSGIATRLGGGIDIPFNDSMALRLDYSHISSHLQNLFTGQSEWQGSNHASVGVVFMLGN
jgi:hypothetical protein